MRYLLLLISYLITINSFAQSPPWSWTSKADGRGRDEATGIKTDLLGNIYTIGNSESDTLIWDSVVLEKGGGLLGKFISKHSPDGSLLWMKSIPGSGFVTALDVDGLGNCFVTGYFVANGLPFGSDTLTTDPNGSYDLFLLKFDGNGNEIWGKTAGGKFPEYGYAVATDPSGAVYVAGSKGNDTMFFAQDVLVNNVGNENALLLKFDSQGNELWGKNSELGFQTRVNGIAVDNSGACYILGNYYGAPIIFGKDTLSNSIQEDEVFLVKYSSQGDLLWSKKGGGNDADEGQSIKVDNASNIVISGATASTVFTFGPLKLSVSKARWFDIYLLKLDTSGNPIWGKRIGGMDNEKGNAIAVDATNNIFIAGRFASSSLEFETSAIKSDGASDVYVAKYSSSGGFQWVKTVGGKYFDVATSVSVQGGNIYICGGFISDTLDFPQSPLFNSGDEDMFIGKLEEPLSVKSFSDPLFSLDIYPNPFVDRIKTTVRTPNVSFKLINTLGTVIWCGSELSQTDFSFLPSGLYMLIASDERQSKTIKLFKE